MKYKINIEKAASKYIRKQSYAVQDRLLHAIYRLPFEGDIKKLQASHLYRLRVGSMRVLYRVDHVAKVVNIDDIDQRGGVYK